MEIFRCSKKYLTTMALRMKMNFKEEARSQNPVAGRKNTSDT